MEDAAGVHVVRVELVDLDELLARRARDRGEGVRAGLLEARQVLADLRQARVDHVAPGADVRPRARAGREDLGSD